MYTGKTESGFEFSIDERTAESWDVVEAVTDTLSDDTATVLQGTKNLAYSLLGKEGMIRLKKHVYATNNGFCTFEMMEKEIIEIFNACKASKNS